MGSSLSKHYHFIVVCRVFFAYSFGMRLLKLPRKLQLLLAPTLLSAFQYLVLSYLIILSFLAVFFSKSKPFFVLSFFTFICTSVLVYYTPIYYYVMLLFLLSYSFPIPFVLFLMVLSFLILISFISHFPPLLLSLPY